MSSALQNKHADLLGIGRMSVLYPDLPNMLRTHDPENPFVPIEDPSPRSPDWWPKLAGSGVMTAWYIVSMKCIAAGKKLPLTAGPTIVLRQYFGECVMIKYICIGTFFTVSLITAVYFLYIYYLKGQY